MVYTNGTIHFLVGSRSHASQQQEKIPSKSSCLSLRPYSHETQYFDKKIKSHCNIWNTDFKAHPG